MRWIPLLAIALVLCGPASAEDGQAPLVTDAVGDLAGGNAAMQGNRADIVGVWVLQEDATTLTFRIQAAVAKHPEPGEVVWYDVHSGRGEAGVRMDYLGMEPTGAAVEVREHLESVFIVANKTPFLDEPRVPSGAGDWLEGIYVEADYYFGNLATEPTNAHDRAPDVGGATYRLGTLSWADSDGDGLFDADELRRGLDPASRDSDGDTLEDAAEDRMGLDPGSPDTDNDTLRDDRELALGTDPRDPDTDNDGLKDGWDFELSDPFDPDSDGDGLRDGDEGPRGLCPCNPDVDGDGMPDGYEVQHGLDPSDRKDAGLDPDGDGRTNLEEYRGLPRPRPAATSSPAARAAAVPAWLSLGLVLALARVCRPT